MTTFTIEKAELSKLLIDGKFARYIKEEERLILIKELADLLKEKQITHEPLESGQVHNLEVEDKDVDTIRQILLWGKEKKPIVFPEDVQHSVDRNLVTHSYRDLTAFSQFWKSSSKEKQFSLYEQLSQDLIETPYVDVPSDAIFSFGKTAFHTNHGTTHAIRQVEYTRNYLEKIKLAGNPTYKRVAESISKEEEACLELAAYLFRSGRTNERGWGKDGGDSTYGKRSAAIFRQIALELNFNKDLVDLIASSCFDYHAPLATELLEPSQVEVLNKITLFRKLLKLSHESDLVRCFTSYEDIKRPIVEELSSLVDETATRSVERIADQFLNYAVTLCKQTGSTITGARESSQNSGSTRKLEVDSALMPKSILYKLLAFKPECLPQFISPTRVWVTSEEHIRPHGDSFLVKAHDKKGKHIDKVEAGWTESQIALIPTKECIAIEEEFLTTHIAVYHATTRASYALDLFCRYLKELTRGENHTAWVRDFHSKPFGRLFSNIDAIKELMSGDDALDNKEVIAWHLLSCNPSLWHNADFDSMESSVDFFFNNTSVLNLGFKTIMFTLMDQAGLLVGYPDQREELFARFNEFNKESVYGKHGVMYQYLIPHYLVDEVAYISGTNGIVDAKNLGALETLLKLKTEGGDPVNANTMQVRLFVPKLLDPENAPRIKIENYMGLSPDLRAKFEQSVKDMADFAFKGPTKGVKVKPIEEKPTQSAYPPVFFKRAELDLSAYGAAKKEAEAKKDSEMAEDLDPFTLM